MKNVKSKKSEENEMLPEYDFKDGIRGKHYKAYRKGHFVKIHKTDGKIETKYFSLDEGSIMLEPDVRKYFPDSDSVNKALRSLLDILPARVKLLGN